ncbi:Polyprotein [Phytophthora palmivora]|uniref:Polyprotein n=1 Tax=Phytophthora palmivora TaxID=4796 RepID=A0A2P4XM19_9STRA|nr:Polyprotein [Phytophthora palmivora]
MVCFPCRKSGHRAAVCRAPAPVITYVEHSTSGKATTAAQPKPRPGPVGAGCPTGWNGGPGPPVADRSPSPPVLHAHFNAITTSGDSRLIIVSLLVAGPRRPLRALLDSGATNNFFRASCLSVLPDSVRVRNGPGEVEIKLADGKARRVARREVSLSYPFDGFHSNDGFLVIEMNYAFDCILGFPWLARYQPQIDWLARSVKRPHDFDVSEVFTHLVVAPRYWPHVTVVPHDDAAVGPQLPPRATGAVEDELSRLEEDISSSSESDTSVSSSGTRSIKTFRRSRRRLKPRRNFADPPPGPTELVCIIEYEDGAPSKTRVIEVASPPRDAKSITRLPGLSWKKFLRDLKAGDIEQVCLITDADSVPHETNSFELDDASSRPKSAEPKSARKERFAAQSWETLKASASGINLTSVSPEMDLRDEIVAAYTDDAVYANILAGGHDPETLRAVTRSKAKQALATPGPAASPLAAWTARTLIDPGNTGTQVAANYAPKSPTRQVDNAAVSAFVQRRASTPVLCAMHFKMQWINKKRTQTINRLARRFKVLPGLRDLRSRLLSFRLSVQSTIRCSLHIPLEHPGVSPIVHDIEHRAKNCNIFKY